MNINEPRNGTGIILPFFTKKPSMRSRTSSLKSDRLPFLNWVPDNARNHLVATIAEYVGTTLFLLFAFAGTQVALAAYPAEPNVVSLGMCLVGALPYLRGAFLVFAQILGGVTAAAIVSALLPGPLTVRTSLGGGTTVVQGLFIEMFLSALLVFTIFMLAAEKHKGTFIAPVGIGLSLFVAELMGVYYTGGSVNPARSFGPSVVTHNFHSYHWIYWVGPMLGAIVASGFYLLMKMLEYETANPGQDSSKPDGEHFNPDLDAPHPKVSFAPEEYTAAEEGRGSINAVRTHGIPLEYGMQSRPFSKSPAPPHMNDQYRGLANGGMHASEADRIVP
ncbi:related to aquaporin [Rhynchosporium agropyri]|uniref:Related to aquaporin n=1 Tax=Rhynchosporium agropyri TaxID=914238 RepID=A0A1E1K1J3_9HELO|nr:related to aquaporin [Rhynchosporium agropyri]